MSKQKEIASFLIAICIFISLFVFLDWNSTLLLLDINSIIYSTLLIYLLFLTNGYQLYYSLNKTYNSRLSVSEVLFLPTTMHLFGYLVPFRGSYLFSIFYFKMKYKMSIVKSGAAGLLTLIINLLISGLFLVLLSYYFEGPLFIKINLMGFLLLTTFFMPNIYLKLNKNRSFPHKSLNEITKKLTEISSDLSEMTKDYYQVFTLILITIINIIIQSIWFLSIGNPLSLNLSYENYLMYAILLRLSVFIRILPGNLGIQEIFSGLISELIGIGFDVGITIGLLFRITSLSISILIGIPYLYLNRSHFHGLSFFNLLKKIRPLDK